MYTLEDVELSRTQELADYLEVNNDPVSFACRLRDYGVVEDHGLLSDPDFLEKYKLNDNFLSYQLPTDRKYSRIEAAIIKASDSSEVSLMEANRRGLIKKEKVRRETIVTIDERVIVSFVTDRPVEMEMEEFLMYSYLARTVYPFSMTYLKHDKRLTSLFDFKFVLLIDYLRDHQDDELLYKRIKTKGLEMSRALDKAQLLIGNLTPHFLYVDEYENIWILDFTDSIINSVETNIEVFNNKWDLSLFTEGLKPFDRKYNFTSTFSGERQEDEEDMFEEDLDMIDDNDFETVDEESYM